jgi:uncharacterized lipoprotein YddW (UPF0748 family)
LASIGTFITHRSLLLAMIMIAALLPIAPRGALAQSFADPTIVAADGTAQRITAIDPPSRTAGLLALYTPAFGPTTKTNQFGGEAVLIKTGQPNEYRVESVCTVFAGSACSNAGNNAIPANGAVLSAAPGGTPDVRLFIRDKIRQGDLVKIYIPVRRTATRQLNAIDPTPQTNPAGVDPGSGQCYPGCRGAEQFILYTPAFGDRTGTNDFGYEVVVRNDRIVARGGNNNAIPDDGYVLSGHGSVGTWLSANTIVGAAVEVNGLTVTITIDPAAYIFTAQQTLEGAIASLETARESCIDVPYAQSQAAIDEAANLIEQAQAALDAGGDQGAVDLAQAAEARANIARFRTIESRVTEGRGLWVRPTEKTRSDVINTLDQIAAAGYNLVYLETFWNGYTIFPSETATRYGIEAQYPQFAGIDLLQVYVEEAHARGIELHAWVEDFFVGSDEVGGAGPILKVYPQWAAVEREDVGKPGPQPSAQEKGYYFLDPAIPEARGYLLDLYTEMLQRYEIDGVHLDYIRYPISLPVQNSFSYSDYSRNAFKELYGVDPLTITPDANPEQWAQWNAWRENNITTFVGEVREIIDATRPEAGLSSAVFPTEQESRIKKLQNWQEWVDRGWMDFMAGMSFGRSADSVARDTTAMREQVDGKTLIYTGVYAPFLGLSPSTLVDQIEGVRGAGSHGVSVFAWNQISAGHLEATREGPFRTLADAPHSQPATALKAGVRDLERRVNDVYVPGGCMDERSAKSASKTLDQISKTLERIERERGNPIPAWHKAQRELDDLQRQLDRNGNAIQPALSERLQAEIENYRSVVVYALR